MRNCASESVSVSVRPDARGEKTRSCASAKVRLNTRVVRMRPCRSASVRLDARVARMRRCVHENVTASARGADKRRYGIARMRPVPSRALSMNSKLLRVNARVFFWLRSCPCAGW